MIHYFTQEREQFSGVGSIRPHMESIERMVADVSHLERVINYRVRRRAICRRRQKLRSLGGGLNVEIAG